MLLAIDTATHVASLALHDGGSVRAEMTWQNSGRHTGELMPRIVSLIGQNGVEALTGVAVSIGPGSFTGLRVGLAVAKGLALARDLPIVGVPTLDVIAQAQARFAQPGSLVAVLQAGRGKLATMRYIRSARLRGARSGSGWRSQGSMMVTTLDRLGEDWDKPMWLCGELDAAERASIQARLGERVLLVEPAASLRRAGYLAEIGWQRIRAGEVDNLDTLQPIYISTAGIT